jgi:hypothetical protein
VIGYGEIAVDYRAVMSNPSSGEARFPGTGCEYGWIIDNRSVKTRRRLFKSAG